MTITENFQSCPRCGGDHEGVSFRPFVQPVAPPEQGVSFRPFVQPVAPPELDFAWTYWATCPTTGDPILLAIAE